MAGAETLLALSLNLVRDGRIGMNRLFALLTANPAKILGIEAGDFATGSAADIIFIDPDTPWQVDSDKMAASAGNRSEEHTSELQSLIRISYAVFCLKKKNKNTHSVMMTNTHNTSKQ